MARISERSTLVTGVVFKNGWGLLSHLKLFETRRRLLAGQDIESKSFGELKNIPKWLSGALSKAVETCSDIQGISISYDYDSARPPNCWGGGDFLTSWVKNHRPAIALVGKGHQRRFG